jgi:hypothetical protein
MAVIDDNLGGLRNRVRRWLHEVNPDNSFWSDTFINQMLNVAYRSRCTDLVMAFEGYFTNVATRDLEADVSRYTWPQGFERITKMEIVRTDGTTVPVERHERHYARNSTPQTGGDGYLPTYRSISGGFVLEPGPSQDVVDGLRIEFFGLPTLMQEDGDSMHVDFPRSLDELVVLDAVISCTDSENLLETGAVRSALRNRQEFEMRFARYIDNRMVSTNKITPFAPHYADS